MIVLAAPAAHALAAPVMLPGGEPDPNCPELRLWLRADSGVQDTQGRSPADPDFNGRAAAWNDRSPQKFNLAAAPGRAPLFVPQQPAAGNRPTVAFSGGQVLTRLNRALNDRPTSAVVLVVQGQLTRGNHPPIYSIGGGQQKRERLSLVFSRTPDPALERLAGLYLCNRGEREYHLDLGLPGDRAGGGRFAVIIANGQSERRSLEFHDGLSGFLGGERMVRELGEQQSACDRCGKDFYLGGDNEEFFCGQIAETMVFNRGLSLAERRALVKYLRRRYELDVAETLLSTAFLLQAEDFEGNWTSAPVHPPELGRYLGRQHVTAEGKEADEGIKTTIHVPRSGTYQVWVRAMEHNFNAKPPSKSALKTIVGGKELRVTHVRGPGGVVWREAGAVELKAGPVEIVVRGEGPGKKDCDAVLISPTADTAEEVEDLCALVYRLRRLGGAARLTAVFDNGLRLDGSLLSGWRWIGPAGQVPRPDRAAVPPLLCLQFDRPRAEPQRPPTAMLEATLEFRNGDRLRGEIRGFVPASSHGGRPVPGQLLVRPSAGILEHRDQTVSVDVDWLRRVVFDGLPHGSRCPSQTLLCRDGRRCAFRMVRWGADSVSVMTEDNLQRVPFGEVAELRMAPDDAWETYCRELAVLDPEGKAAILRVETSDGLAITSSTFRPSSTIRSVPRRRPGEGDAAQRRREREGGGLERLLHPVWSREPIPVPWGQTRLIWQAPAHVAPLSRFAPQQVVERAALGGSWKWQSDRNVAGGVLRSGAVDYLWGFGVHAPSEMVFQLPPCAKALRTAVGIDDTMGRAGRAVAKIYLNDAAGKPLYQSGPLVGGQMAVSTGEIALPDAAGARRRLVLAAESGDLLDIGNHLDWLEPTLLLDPVKLHAEVARQRAASEH